MTRKLLSLASVVACAIVLAACPEDVEVGDYETAETVEGPTLPSQQPPAEPEMAAARLLGPNGEEMGVVTFTEQEEGTVLIVAQIESAPAGEHGIHLHDAGECGPPSFEAAGGHFNPTGVAHGGPDAPVHHAGDFGNVTVGDDGAGHLELTSDTLNVGGAGPPAGATVEPAAGQAAPAEGEAAALTHDVVGHALVLHAQADDLTSQPTGAAGGRIACGVVEMGTGPEAGSTEPAPAPGEAPPAGEEAI